MLSTRTLTSRLATGLFKSTLPRYTLPSIAARTFTTTPATMGKDSKMPADPPKHEMKYFKGLTSEVRAFGQFRKVMHTGLYSQLVSMEIPPGGDIGNEVHTVDQVLIFTSGEAKAIIAGKEQDCKQSDVVVVPAGTEHQFINTSKTQPLEVVTVYSPAEHDPRTVHKTKEEGDEEEESGKDEAPAWSQQSKDTNEKQGLVKEEGGPYKAGDDGRHNRKIPEP